MRPFVRLRGRSFMAVVLMPDNPVEAWLEQLDAQLARSPKFFDGRAVMLDFSALAGQERSFPTLLDELKRRHIRIMGVEGVDPNRFGDELPPVLSGGRHVAMAPDEPPPPELKPPEPISLVVNEPVRSGQSINFPGGDVTIVGSVASGSEVIAGGSIHVYGALRGRAIAGLLGAAIAAAYLLPQARCRVAGHRRRLPHRRRDRPEAPGPRRPGLARGRPDPRRRTRLMEE